MSAEDMLLIQNELNKSRDELLELIVALRKQLLEYQSYMTENSSAITAMSREYQKLLTEVKSLRQENKDLREILAHVAEKDQLKTKELFGRGTEKLSDIYGSAPDMEEIDEAETEIIELPHSPFPLSPKDHEPAGEKDPAPSYKEKNSGKKRKPTDLSKLPAQERFLLDIRNLNETYGEGNWRIAYWHCHRSVEHNRAVTYVVNYYSPVVSVGLEHELKAVPYSCLLPRSFVSASLMAEILYQKYFLSVPLYRQELSFANFGLALSRQTMCSWVIRFAFEYFSIIADRLQELMMEIPYHQCDETTLRVNRDGRHAGSKSYVWVHITSELYDTNPIILFCYELTRGTDHLRKFYEDFKGFITCDAYCAYQTLEKEKQDVITVCGCMMHMRRRFVQSLVLIPKDGMDQDMIDMLPETQALTMIGKIYDADEKLKNLSAEERGVRRELNVRPLVEQFYSYLDTLDTNAPEMSNRLKDAVNYAQNQKKYLCRFLGDGNIPIDDGATERHIRPFAIGRSNFLFCDSIDGAKATSIMYTIVETAKANHANVYCYLRYVLEEMPQYMSGTDMSFVDKLLPWSAEYREYERIQTSSIPMADELPGSAIRPKTPKKGEQRIRTDEQDQIA